MPGMGNEDDDFVFEDFARMRLLNSEKAAETEKKSEAE
jgi:hypothetical protein